MDCIKETRFTNGKDYLEFLYGVQFEVYSSSSDYDKGYKLKSEFTESYTGRDHENYIPNEKLRAVNDCNVGSIIPVGWLSKTTPDEFIGIIRVLLARSADSRRRRFLRLSLQECLEFKGREDQDSCNNEDDSLNYLVLQPPPDFYPENLTEEEVFSKEISAALFENSLENALQGENEAKSIRNKHLFFSIKKRRFLRTKFRGVTLDPEEHSRLKEQLEFYRDSMDILTLPQQQLLVATCRHEWETIKRNYGVWEGDEGRMLARHELKEISKMMMR